MDSVFDEFEIASPSFVGLAMNVSFINFGLTLRPNSNNRGGHYERSEAILQSRVAAN